MDNFCETIKQTTVMVVDNASLHTSHAFNACVASWVARGLLVYHLPPYSHELDSIEQL
ncbi:MAG: transposase [Rhodopirellula sp. JB053]